MNSQQIQQNISFGDIRTQEHRKNRVRQNRRPLSQKQPDQTNYRDE